MGHPRGPCLVHAPALYSHRMDTSAYRQSLEGKRAQLEQLRTLARERVDTASALERALRTDAEREAVNALQRRIDEHPTDSLEQLTALESRLADLETLADELSRADRSRTSIPQLPLWSEDECSSALLHEEPWMAELGAMLEEVSVARSVRLGDFSYGSRHEAGGVPLNLRASAEPHAGGTVHVSVVVAVPTGLPHVRLVPEGWLLRVGRLFGLAHEATVDHEAFDHAFHVEWPDDLARVVFDAALCETFATTRCKMEIAQTGQAMLSLVTHPTELVPSLQALVGLAQALALRLYDLSGTPRPTPRARTSPKEKPRSELTNTSTPARNFTISFEDRVRSYGEAPAYSRRLRGIEDTVDKTLGDLRDALDVSMAAAHRVLGRVDFAKLNRTIAEHNRNYPMEANLPIDPETGRPRVRDGLFEPMAPWTEERFLQAAEDLRAAQREP